MDLGAGSECRSLAVIARDPMFIIAARVFELGSRTTREGGSHSICGLANNTHAATIRKLKIEP
jgi:hypothetical protein